ncbi:MAG: hypothetical protein WCA64_11820 [Gallionella sp.]
MRSANAGAIDHIEIREAGNEAEIRIVFITQIQYLRQAALSNGDVRIYFNLLGISALDPRLVPDRIQSPPSDVVQRFSVTYPEIDSSLSISFGKRVDYHIRLGKDARSISIFTPALKPKSHPAPAAAAGIAAATPAIASPAIVPGIVPPVPPLAASRQAEQVAPVQPIQPEPSKPLPPPLPVAAIELEAQQLIGSARYALQNDRPDIAIERLNKLLNLPPNKESQAAQELIGEAREMNGEYDKARVEYQSYIELYPRASDVAKVKLRMAKLPAVNKARLAPVQETAKVKVVEEKMQFSGGISQYYYKGISNTDSITVSGATSTTSSLTLQDQSQLFSTLDLMGHKRSETADTRLVFRDSYNKNFLPGQVSNNRFDAAYIEQNARDHSYAYRVGRQNGLGAGAPGQFDGAWGGYRFDPTWRVNAVVGKPVEYFNGGLRTSSNKDFAGMSVDLSPRPEIWSSTGYFIQQRVSGIVERRAVGAEGHYFEAGRNLMGLFEYDTLFKKVDLAMFQGNWTTGVSTNYNVLVDHRRSPPLQLSNALIGQPLQSVAALLQSGVAMNTIIADASAFSPISNTFGVGVNLPYSERIRYGGDFRVSNMSSTGGTSTGQPGLVGTGNTYSYSAQATVNGVFRQGDFGLVNATYSTASTYSGQSLLFTQVEPLPRNWRVDAMLLLYSQASNTGTHQTQIRPSLRLNYRLNNSVNLEGEGGIEQTHVNSAAQDDTTRRKYFYVGYRWDFQ